MNKLEYIYKYYGKAIQGDKLLEEAQEVVDAVNSGDIENLHEEVADLMLLIDQLISIYKLDTYKIHDYMIFKLNRTIRRIDEEIDCHARKVLG